VRPKKIHFITGMRADFGGKPFNIVHMLAILSARLNYPDHEIFVHYEYEPEGQWWDYARQFVTCRKTIAPRQIFGRKVEHFAHAADVLRLQLLIEEGGIYFDTDTMVCRPIADLPDDQVIMGIDAGNDHQIFGLSNAFIAAPSQSDFLINWLDGYRDFDAADYISHSVKLPFALAQEKNSGVHIETRHAFCYPHNDQQSLRNLFTRRVDVSNSYSIHLWESVSWDYITGLTPETIARENTTYNGLANIILSEFPDSPATMREWPVEIRIDQARLPKAALDRPAFWYVTLHDAQGNQLMRCDAELEEVNGLVATGASQLVLGRAVKAVHPPASWVVQPTDRRRQWLNRLEGKLGDGLVKAIH